MPTLDAENREVEVVLDREAEEEPRRLVRARQPERDPATGREDRHVPAEELDAPRRRRELAGDHVEERRLPGPVRAEDRPALAGANLEIDVANGFEAAEAPADPPQTEGRLGACDCLRCYGHGPFTRSSLCMIGYPVGASPTTSALPAHGRSRVSHTGLSRSGGGVSGVKVPPKSCPTCGIFKIVVTASAVTILTKLSWIAARFSSRLTGPYGASRTTPASASRKAAWPSERSPPTASSACAMASAAL